MPMILEKNFGPFHNQQVPAVVMHRIIDVINLGMGRDHVQNVPKPVFELIHRMSELYGFHQSIRLLLHLGISSLLVTNRSLECCANHRFAQTNHSIPSNVPLDVLFDRLRRNPGYERIGRHVLRHDRPGRNDSAFADRNALQDNCLAADPYIVLDDGWLRFSPSPQCGECQYP